MNNLTFRVVSDESEAKIMWEMFSPHKSLDDEWDFRYTWFRYIESPLHFIVGYDNDNPIGLLPLQFNQVKGLDAKLLNMNQPFLEFFGGVDTDDNRIFLKEDFEIYELKFFQEIKSPAILTSLPNPVVVGENTSEFYLDRFSLALDTLTDFKSFLKTHFDGKSRQRLINRINRVHKNYAIEIRDAKPEDIEILFELSKDRFGEGSSFNLEYRRKIFTELTKLFTTDIFTIYVNNLPKAVSYAIVHNNVYTSLNMGYDYTIDDLGKVVFATQIERALAKNCTTYDAGQGDNGWKEHFRLTKIPQYQLSLNII